MYLTFGSRSRPGPDMNFNIFHTNELSFQHNCFCGYFYFPPFACNAFFANNKYTNICLNEKNNNDFLITPLFRQMFADPFLGIYEFYDLVTAQEHIYCKDSTNYEAVIDLDSLQTSTTLKTFYVVGVAVGIGLLA